MFDMPRSINWRSSCHRELQRVFCVVLLVLLTVFPMSASQAQNTLRLSLPVVLSPQGSFTSLKRYSKLTGLRIELEKKGFDQNGYAVFEVGILAKAATSKDRKITVRFFSIENTSQENNLTISKTFTLKANQQQAVTTLLVPQLFAEKNGIFLYSFITEVDGKLDQQLSQQKSTWLANRFANPNGIASDGIQAIVPFAFSQSSLNQNNLQPGLPNQTGRIFSFRDNLYRYQLQQNLAENWLTYTSADVVRVDANRIEMAIQSQPAEWKSLMDWVATGGNLWIEQTGSKAAALVEITNQLQLSDWYFDQSEGVDIRKPAVPGWKYDSLIVKSANNPVDATKEILDLANQNGLQETLQSLTQNPDTAGWYAWYPYGMGRVYAFKGRVEDYPGNLQRSQRRSGFSKLHSQNWSSRHGIVLGEKCSTFANLLIPGVGVAPVVEFQVLITLFVLLIGPLNYWLLYRLNRLHLLVLTTPLVAAFITGSLLFYALFCDGFGVSARVRSLTLLNQEKEEAICWSRMTHYAGSPPQGGLVLPADAAIYPILPGYESAIAGTNPKQREINWDGKNQNLVSGWLPSRTAVQHLVLRKGEAKHRLDILSTAGNDLEISNQLGADIEWLLVRKADSDWKVGYEIPVGSKRKLEPITLTKATVDLRILAVENKPSMPDGAGKEAGDMLANFGNSRSKRDFGSANLEENLLNRFIERLSGIDGSRGLAVPTQSYIAVTRSAVEAPLGLAEIEESGSFHITVGKW